MGWVRRRGTMIVELLTDDGVTGWGESLCHGLQPPEIARTIVEVALKPLLIGQDPAAEAKRHMSKGFIAMKLKTVFGVEDDIKYILGVREGIGDGPKLMVDANHAYNVGAAPEINRDVIERYSIR
jgi:L-alanine-DL-glutamate epimerase-like enolase superfamily enzyme